MGWRTGRLCRSRYCKAFLRRGSRRRRGGPPLPPGIRIVVLHVTDGQHALARVVPGRRRLAAMALRRYGSPVCLSASRRLTVPVVEVVGLLRRYTTAPVTWV